MRLKDNVNPSKSALARCGQRRPDLRRMVTVVVDDANAVHPAFHLEAAIYAIELLQRFANALDRNIQTHSHGYRGGCVEHVMRAGHAQAKLAQVGAAIANTEAAQRKAFAIAGSKAFDP